jgi:hypothetical protein
MKRLLLANLIFFTVIHTVFSQPVWDAAKKNSGTLTLSGWFTAQDVNNLLNTPEGLDRAVSWCKRHGVTKVYLEAFGRGLYADRKNLLEGKSRFQSAGFEVQSGVTTTKFGKDGFGDGWNGAQCYTNPKTQDELQKIFEYAASLFDVIIIDDWFFTQCQCDECIRARGDQTWSKYYGDLMVKMSERIVKASHAVNPKVRVIIKFPQWYDQFHMRGYEVEREPKIFDGIWAGTETRNFDYENGIGYEIGYNAFFNMRWLATLGNLGGGWFDSGRTTEDYFLEQARHTVLGNGKEIILWCYSHMLEETNGSGAIKGTPAVNMTALAKELPALTTLAGLIRDKPLKGVLLLKPGNSEQFEEEWVCSFLGELGIPFVPATRMNELTPSAVFPVQALKDPVFPEALKRMLNKGTPVVITDGLAKRLTAYPDILNNGNLSVLQVGGSPKKLLKMTREELAPLRNKLLAPLGMKFDAPAKVELYLFGDNYFVVENINDNAVDVTLELPRVSGTTKLLTLPESGNTAELTVNQHQVNVRNLSARSLIVVQYQ